jgi:hypothetical protein
MEEVADCTLFYIEATTGLTIYLAERTALPMVLFDEDGTRFEG